MAVFVTGAAGYIGSSLALKLAREGETVHALFRNSVNKELEGHPTIKIFTGDILEPESLNAGMDGCDKVFHLAALAAPWAKNRDSFDKINVDGGSATIFL